MSSPALRELRVMAWNACSIKGKFEEILLHATKHQVDIIMLSEIKLPGSKNWKLPGFQSYIAHDPTAIGRAGAMLLVRSNLNQSALLPIRETEIQMARCILHAGGEDIQLGAVYIPPQDRRRDRDLQMSTLWAISHELGSTFLIGGDLNAKHTSWNDIRSNHYGVGGIRSNCI